MRNYWTFAAIQKKISSARIPKMISGSDTAKPICSHCRNDLPPSPAVPEVTVRQIHLARFAVRLEPAPLLAEFRPRVVHRAEGAAQFFRQIRRVPALGLDRFEQLEVLGETFVSRADLFELLLRIVTFPFQDHERSRELVRHFRPPALQFFLAPAQLFQLALLLLDLFRLPLQLQELFLRFLHLRIEVLRRHRLFFA